MRNAIAAFFLFAGAQCSAQLIDRTKAPNPINEGIAKSLEQEIGAGRGDWNTPNSSSFLIQRDPFRAIRRGRQLFQRKFQHLSGAENTFYARDGSGSIESNLAIGAGLADSCSSCHGRPRGSAGFGGDVVTRPDSRDAPHLFGLGLKEMLADEITAELRDRRLQAVTEAAASHQAVTRLLTAKGIQYGTITANPNGTVDTSKVEGVDPDLRVRPFFAHGGTMSIREFIAGAMNNEMGFQCFDPEITAAGGNKSLAITPAGMVLDGRTDTIEMPPDPDPSKVQSGQSPRNQMATAVVDYLEFYLLNYFKPGLYEQTPAVLRGRETFDRIGCGSCHISNLRIDRDRRVADLETVYDPDRGNFNHLFATATPLIQVIDDGNGLPTRKVPKMEPFLVKNIFTDFKRHDLGPNFWERNYDGTYQHQFLTAALWGVGTTAPYGHDGRSANLAEVILRHGGEAQSVRDRFAALTDTDRTELLEFLRSLVLFPPDDTASTLDPGDKLAVGFPQLRHGAIKLTVLFNDPAEIE
ncbi:MAG: thiol oxidoreductase-like protein [Acidobacteriota bacterium]|nr:thiol oxidoreductase-like protein [Acidobacteriota bacterium]